MNLKKSLKISVIVVTHNSMKFIDKCVSGLEKSLDNGFIELIIVDCKSDDSSYLDNFKNRLGIKLIRLKNNVGFSKGNNLGVSHINNKSKYILFLNPDAFVSDNLLNKIYKKMESQEFQDVAICSPILLGYSVALSRPTGLIDSAGIRRTWYGRYYDFYKGKAVNELLNLGKSEFESLICGAFMFCRKKALLERVKKSSIWDEEFFMYKEDIELSLYLKFKGWRLIVIPEYHAYHCRGWSKNRMSVSEFSISESLKSDWKLVKKSKREIIFKFIDITYLALKTFFVISEIAYRRIKNLMKGNKF